MLELKKIAQDRPIRFFLALYMINIRNLRNVYYMSHVIAGYALQMSSGHKLEKLLKRVISYDFTLILDLCKG